MILIRYCRKCGKSILDGNKFCAHCGAPTPVITTAEKQPQMSTAQTCGSCGADVPGGKKFCAKCGAPISGQENAPAQNICCVACGTTLSANMKFCAKCGKPQPVLPAARPTNTYSQSAPNPITQAPAPIKRKRHRIWIPITAAATALVLFLIILAVPAQNHNTVNSTVGVTSDELPDIVTMMTSSPYYYIPVDTGGEKSNRYAEYMNTLTADSLTAADTLMDSYYIVRQDIFEIENMLSTLIPVCDEYTGFARYGAQEVLDAIERLQSVYETCQILYECTEIDDYGEAWVNTQAVSDRVCAALCAGSAIDETYHTLASIAATMINEYTGMGNSTFQQQLDALDDHMQNANSFSELEKITVCTQTIGSLLDYIELARTEVVLEQMELIALQADQVFEDIETASANSDIDPDLLELAKEEATVLLELSEEITANLSEYANDVQPDPTGTYSAISFNAENRSAAACTPVLLAAGQISPIAYSDFGNSVSITQSLDQYQKSDSFWSDTWNSVKNTAGTVWDDSVARAEAVREVVGYGVEGGSLFTYTVVRKASGWINGLSADDETREYLEAQTKIDIQDYISEQYERVQDEGAGGEVFTNMTNGLDYVKQQSEYGMTMVGEELEPGLIWASDTWNDFCDMTGMDYMKQNVDLKGYLPKLTGFMGNAAVGTFTQLAEGLSRLANPRSTEADRVRGTIEVLTSFIGGSSNVFTASGAGKTVLTKGKLLSEMLEDYGVKGTGGILKDGFKNALTKLDDIFAGKVGQVVDKMAKTLKTNTGKSIFSSNWREVIGNLKGIFTSPTAQQALGNGFKELLTETVDHLVGIYIDGKLTDAVSKNLDFFDAVTKTILGDIDSMVASGDLSQEEADAIKESVIAQGSEMLEQADSTTPSPEPTAETTPEPSPVPSAAPSDEPAPVPSVAPSEEPIPEPSAAPSQAFSIDALYIQGTFAHNQIDFTITFLPDGTASATDQNSTYELIYYFYGDYDNLNMEVEGTVTDNNGYTDRWGTAIWIDTSDIINNRIINLGNYTQIE